MVQTVAERILGWFWTMYLVPGLSKQLRFELGDVTWSDPGAARLIER